MTVRPSGQSWGRLLECRLFQGQLDDAIAMTAVDTLPWKGTPLNDQIVAMLTAGKTHNDGDRAKAKTLSVALANSAPPFRWISVQSLAWLDLVDDAFDVADEWAAAATPDMDGDYSFLFGRMTESMRRDPRFMKLAARIGLVDYWQSSGHWPDFCSDPKLPYDCRAEAVAPRSGRSRTEAR